MDLTTGNLFWKIPLFALPMALTTILQLLYTTVDLYTVANFGGGSNSMSAVGSNSALINLLVSFFVSIAVGANVALGNAKGANHKDVAQKLLKKSSLNPSNIWESISSERLSSLSITSALNA